MTPDELLNLAAKQVIRPGGVKNSKNYGQPEALTLQKMENAPSEDGSPVWLLRQAQPGETSFTSYICDYDEGQINYQVLSTEANFCVTTAINGCTFALGMPASDGTLIVSHTNMIAKKMDKDDLAARGTMNQADFQQQVATEFHKTGSLLDPSVYWADKQYVGTARINVGVYGVRRIKDWEFWVQRFTVTGGVHKLIDFAKFDTNTKKF